jgi:hypothetical protein
MLKYSKEINMNIIKELESKMKRSFLQAARGVLLGHSVPDGYKYKDLALQLGEFQARDRKMLS